MWKNTLQEAEIFKINSVVTNDSSGSLRNRGVVSTLLIKWKLPPTEADMLCLHLNLHRNGVSNILVKSSRLIFTSPFRVFKNVSNLLACVSYLVSEKL